MKKKTVILLTLCACLVALAGCSFSFSFGRESNEEKANHTTVSEALSQFSESEIITYIENNFVPGQIYDNVTNIATTTWDEIAGNELCDKNGETLWEYVERVLRENEEEQRKTAEEMAPYIESTPAPTTSLGRFDFSAMRDEIVKNEFRQEEVHNLPPINSSVTESP